MAGELTLGIDVGTTATKVLLLSADGEWEMESWPSSEGVWENLKEWLGEVSSLPETSLLARGTRITRVGITGHGPSAIVLRGGEVVGRSFYWYDEIPDEFQRASRGSHVLPNTRAWLPSRIAQWEGHNGPLGEGVVVQLKDMLNWQLTGVVGRDSRSMRGFSGENFFHNPSDVIGLVSDFGSQLSGISAGARVICGCDDLTAGVLGLGVGKGELFNLANTSEHVGVIGGPPVEGMSWLPPVGRLPALSYQATSTGGRTLQQRFGEQASVESVVEFVAELERESASGMIGDGWQAIHEINEPVMRLAEAFGGGKMTIGGGLAVIPQIVESRSTTFGAGREVSVLGVARLAVKPLAVIFGAGKVGRGFLAQLLTRAGWRIHFVEQNGALVSELESRGEYTIVNLATGEREKISDFTVSMDEWRVDEASLILTSIGANGLNDWGQKMAGFDRPIDIILAENHPRPAALVRQHLSSPRVGVAQAQVLRSCIEPTAEQVEELGSLTVQVQDHWSLPLDADALVRDELVRSVSGFDAKPNFSVELTRKLYTYNAINAAVCYPGFIKGHEWLSDAANDPEIAALAERVGIESSAALIAEFGFDENEQQAWCQRALAKYQDATIRDPIERNARDPVRKLGRFERILGPLHLCINHRLPHSALTEVMLTAIKYREESDEAALRIANLVEQMGAWGALSELVPDIDESLEQYFRL